MGEVIQFNDLKKKRNGEEYKEVEADIKERKKEALKKLPNYRGEVNSKTTIRTLPNLKEGQIFWLTLENDAYIVARVQEGKVDLKPLDTNATVSAGLTLYQFNQAMTAQEPLMDLKDEEVLKTILDKITEYITSNSESKFFLLYGRNIHYFTIFERELPMVDPNPVLEAISTVGGLISISIDEKNKALEVWVRTSAKDVELMYFFPFDSGVVKF